MDDSKNFTKGPYTYVPYARSDPMPEHALHLLTESQSAETVRTHLMQIREELSEVRKDAFNANMGICSGLAIVTAWFAWRILGRPRDRDRVTIAYGLCAANTLQMAIRSAMTTDNRLIMLYSTAPAHYRSADK